MQIYADLKGKVALDDITPWANCDEMSRRYHFMFSFDSAFSQYGMV